MKKLLSISCSDWAFNLAMLILRVTSGVLMIPHGYTKLVQFPEKHSTFMNFLGMGSTISLSLVIFAEFFCSMFIVLGLFTRLAAIPLVISMSVALFKVSHGDIFNDGLHAGLFLLCFLVILLCGPGKVSIDGLINK